MQFYEHKVTLDKAKNQSKLKEHLFKMRNPQKYGGFLIEYA